MVWQAENFLIKRLNLCLIGEAMIQMGVSVLHRKRARLQRQMYYKNIIKMLLHEWLCRQSSSDSEAKFMFEMRSCG